MELKTKLSRDALLDEPNIAKLLDPDDVQVIGSAAREGYERDRASRREWEERMADANKLALQVVEEKSMPWQGAANVKFPLITVAALQFQARAYSNLISGTELVKCRVLGEDKDGTNGERAQRIQSHMSWQCLEQDTGWEEDHDKLLFALPICGSVFVKEAFDPAEGRIRSQLVLPRNFVTNYYTRSLDDSPRYTHTFYLTANDIYQREHDGRFINVDSMPSTGQEQSPLLVAQEEREGVRAPAVEDGVTPFLTGEQYCWLDLDGDGYQEPYIVTFDIESGRVRRIVARYVESGIKLRDGKVYRIEPMPVFIKYPFIPSPDGGFYDLGLGTLLGPINASVNTTINQMLDAGTMATLGGGFLGRGFRGKGGPITFAPYQWHPVDAPGDDIRKSVLPLPVREPSIVLFQLLGLLLQYAERVVSATDLQVGENIGQNTPAETARTMNENGARVYSAIYKRIWRSLRNEFRLRFQLNRLFFAADTDGAELIQAGMIQDDDYRQAGIDVCPAADPHVVSDAQAEKQATMLVQLSATQPGFNRYKSMLRLLKVMKTPNIEEVYPQPMGKGPDGKPVPIPDHPAAPNPQMIQAQAKLMTAQAQIAQMQFDQRANAIELQRLAQETQAEIIKKQAEVVKLLAEAETERHQPMLDMLYAEIEADGKHRDALLRAAEVLMKSKMESESNATGETAGTGMEGMGSTTDDQAIPAMAPPVGGGAEGGMGAAPA